MSTKADVMYKNHCVAPNAKNRLVDAEDLVTIQFSRLERTQNGKKYARATVNADRSIMKEIIEKYGLQDVIVGRWETWDKEQKKNVPFQEA